MEAGQPWPIPAVQRRFITAALLWCTAALLLCTAAPQWSMAVLPLVDTVLAVVASGMRVAGAPPAQGVLHDEKLRRGLTRLRDSGDAFDQAQVQGFLDLK